MKTLTGVLLVNLGTPQAPNAKSVYRYLIEFLTDPRVIDYSWLSRQFLVRGIIIPKRLQNSTSSYKKIWQEDGSPLLSYGLKVEKKLQEHLGSNYRVALSMRYQNPSLEEGLKKLNVASLDHLIIIPLFPQYASATTGSVHQKIMELLKPIDVMPKLTFLNHFADHPALIRAFQAVAKPYNTDDYDHILFSFHGLPERQLTKVDPSNHCLSSKECCQTLCQKNRFCYAAQCHATAKAIVNALKLPAEKTSLCFQSRLGKEPWLQPYASDVITKLAHQGKKRVLVFCPSFVSDCLETIYEISVEYQREFEHAGGVKLDLVPGLNDHPAWIEALGIIVKNL